MAGTENFDQQTSLPGETVVQTVYLRLRGSFVESLLKWARADHVRNDRAEPCAARELQVGRVAIFSNGFASELANR